MFAEQLIKQNHETEKKNPRKNINMIRKHTHNHKIIKQTHQILAKQIKTKHQQVEQIKTSKTNHARNITNKKNRNNI